MRILFSKYRFQLFYDFLLKYVLDDEYKKTLKNTGNGLSLVSEQNLNPSDDVENILPTFYNRKQKINFYYFIFR
jgi:hypothetical protein